MNINLPLRDLATGNNKKKQIGLLVIAMSAIGLVLGMLFRKLLFNTFTIGTWISFVAFLLSLASVEDHGDNRIARAAFWVSFLAMCMTIFFGAASY